MKTAATIIALCTLLYSANGQDIFVPRELKTVPTQQSVRSLSDQIALDWKDRIARGQLPYHRLVRSDFPINDKGGAWKCAMQTCGFIQPRYDYRWTLEGDSFVCRITEWQVISGFDRSCSWRKSDFKVDEKAIAHEQIHLAIGELSGRRFANIGPGKLPIGKGASSDEAIADLAKKVDILTKKFVKENQAEQDEYDAKTNHGLNATAQKKATALVQARLSQAGISYE